MQLRKKKLRSQITENIKINTLYVNKLHRDTKASYNFCFFKYANLPETLISKV